MTLPRTEIERILALAEKATPFADSDLMRYDHGGGRLAKLSDADRRLLADFYHENEREYFAALDPATVKQLCEAALRNTAQAQVTEAEVLAALGVYEEMSGEDAVFNDMRAALEAAARARGTGEERG